MPTPEEDKPKGRGKQYAALAEASALGFMFPLAIGIGFAWGWWMDKQFGTWPWLAVVFTSFGVAAAFINLFRFASRNDGRDDRG
jgi:ATP synthase protein I